MQTGVRLRPDAWVEKRPKLDYHPRLTDISCHETVRKELYVQAQGSWFRSQPKTRNVFERGFDDFVSIDRGTSGSLGAIPCAHAA
jgi:hypothetical protein